MTDQRLERSFRLALTAVLLGYGLWLMRSVDGYHFLDEVDLAIHETGHLAFGWAGDVVTALGGTLSQLIVPLLFVGYFLRQRDHHAASVPLWWAGQNCWNIARYVADARAQELPLVGGGEHDWAFLLGQWNALHLDQALARMIRVAALGLMVGSCLWGWLALSRLRASPR